MDNEGMLLGALQKSYRDYFNDKIDYPQYQQAILDLKDKYPEEFAVVHERNTNAMNDQMNRALFSEEVLPFDSEVQRNVGEKLGIPYGYELEDALGGNIIGSYNPLTDKIRVGGETGYYTLMHEGIHPKLDGKVVVEFKGDKPVVASEEYVVRLMDIARSILTDQPEEADRAFEWLDSEGYGKGGKAKDRQQTLLQHLGVALNEISKEYGISDADKRRLIDSYKDRDGLIFDFDGSTLDYRGNYDKEDIQEWVDTTPLAEEVRRVLGVGMRADLPENFYETGFEPTIE